MTFGAPLLALLASAQEPGAGIARAELEAHVRFLASDELLGRATGTPECERAARYLADELAKSGVKPAGDAGTFLQAVPLERVAQLGPPRLVLRDVAGGEVRPAWGAEFEGGDASVSELRIVVVTGDAAVPKPPDPKAALFVDGTNSERRAKLEAAGDRSGTGWGLLIRPGSAAARPAAEFRARPGRLSRAESGPRRPDSITVHGPLLARLRAGELASLSLEADAKREEVTAHNVVGLVRGSAPEAERRALVLSAHYDHLGAKAPPADAPAKDGAAEDRIHNGADDDASGVAAVLELAEELAAGPAPRHDVIVLLAVGEEIGLLGTDEYLDHPAAPLERTLANLNFEMLGRPDEKVGGAGVLWLTGYERTNLGPAFEAASLAIRSDPRPDQHFYQRSDNYAFVVRGTIGQTFSSYDLHEDYHKPSDEADTLDYAHMETATRAAYRAVRLVADGTLSPAWSEGGREPAKK